MNKSDGQDNHTGQNAGSPTEYFCTKCLQLRLSLIADKSVCGNCKSTDIITGSIGTLDKQALLKQHTPKQDG